MNWMELGDDKLYSARDLFGGQWAARELYLYLVLGTAHYALQDQLFEVNLETTSLMSGISISIKPGAPGMTTLTRRMCLTCD